MVVCRLPSILRTDCTVSLFKFRSNLCQRLNKKCLTGLPQLNLTKCYEKTSSLPVSLPLPFIAFYFSKFSTKKNIPDDERGEKRHIFSFQVDLHS